jgi:hypothetical protein
MALPLLNDLFRRDSGSHGGLDLPLRTVCKCGLPRWPRVPLPVATGSEASAPKPRVLTVPNAAAGPYTLIMWNLGPRENSVSYQVVAIH